MKKWVSAQEIAAGDTRAAKQHISAERPIGFTQAKEIRQAVAR